MISFLELFKKEVYRFSSIWVQTILGPLSTAILYQLIFGSQLSKLSTGIEGVNYAAFLIPGLVMMQVLLNSFANASSTFMQSKYTGNIIFILMAPISSLSKYCAYLFSSMLRGVIVGVTVFLGIVWFGGASPKCWWAVFYFMIVGSSVTAGIGIIAGIICDKFDQLGGFQSFIMTPCIYLAGVFFNPDHLYGVWAKLAKLDPFLYIVDGFRYGFIQHVNYDIDYGVLFTGCFAIFINIIGYYLLHIGYNLKK